jgi:hypothetical protein
VLTELLRSTWKVSIATLSVAQVPTTAPERKMIKAVRILNAMSVIPCARPFVAARRLGRV